MAQCQTCKMSGGNMKKCKKCNMIYCASCVAQGRGNYPKVSANKCPHCGALDSSTSFY